MARRVGRSSEAVRVKRAKLGIPAARGRRKREPAREADRRRGDGFDQLRHPSAAAGEARAAAWDRLRATPAWRTHFPLLLPESIP